MTDKKPNIPSTCSIGGDHNDFFNALTPEQMSYLHSKTVEVEYQKGEVISKQGTFISHILVLNEGLVKTYIQGKKSSLVLQIFPSHNIIGLSNLYDGNPILHYSTAAYVKSKLSLIEAAAFRHLVRENAGFASRMLSLMAEYSLVVNSRFFCLTNKQTYGRLADLLICLANRVYKSQIIPLDLSRKDIAELSGMTPESIARILTRFKTDGLIEITCDSIRIADPEKLEMVSQKG